VGAAGGGAQFSSDFDCCEPRPCEGMVWRSIHPPSGQEARLALRSRDGSIGNQLEANVNRTMSRRAVMVLGGAVSAAAVVGLAQAAPQTFSVRLSGAEQVPPVASPGTGTVYFTWDPPSSELTWSATFSGLSSPATMAHIHNGGKGKNGPVVLWLSTRGAPPESPFGGSATLTPTQVSQLKAGDWYVNLHSKNHPAGELRGQVVLPP
jgi:hypothetical protein